MQVPSEVRGVGSCISQNFLKEQNQQNKYRFTRMLYRLPTTVVSQSKGQESSTCLVNYTSVSAALQYMLEC